MAGEDSFVIATQVWWLPLFVLLLLFLYYIRREFARTHYCLAFRTVGCLCPEEAGEEVEESELVFCAAAAQEMEAEEQSCVCYVIRVL